MVTKGMMTPRRKSERSEIALRPRPVGRSIERVNLLLSENRKERQVKKPLGFRGTHVLNQHWASRIGFEAAYCGASADPPTTSKVTKAQKAAGSALLCTSESQVSAPRSPNEK